MVEWLFYCQFSDLSGFAKGLVMFSGFYEKWLCSGLLDLPGDFQNTAASTRCRGTKTSSSRKAWPRIKGKTAGIGQAPNVK